MEHTFIFPSQLKKPEEERKVAELQLGEMSGDYNAVFKDVPHFVDEDTGKVYIPSAVRNKMKELFKLNKDAEEVQMPSYDDILAEIEADVKKADAEFFKYAKM